jgi:UPF0755 protein
MSGSRMSLSDLPGDEHRSSRDVEPRSARVRRERRRRRRRRTTIALLACLGLVAIAVAVVYAVGRPLVEDLLADNDYDGRGSGAVQVQIEAGDSGQAIGTRLVEADVVKSAEAFVDAAAGEPRAASIQPGTYQLKQQMAAEDALSLLLDPASRISLRAGVPEGLRADQVFQRLSESTGLPVEEFRQAVADPAVGLPQESGGNPEGYLFPATYDFEPTVTAVQVLTTMVQRHNAAMEAVGVPPERRRDVLVKASLLEEEAKRDEDFPRVARVLENRLGAGMPLQLDSTVNFVTGKTGITTTDADRATDSPYNTYLHPGLPPGPIDSPGERALAAALKPADGPWLFFVAVNPETGETRYATTVEEHNANVELFRQWLRENQG